MQRAVMFATKGQNSDPKQNWDQDESGSTIGPGNSKNGLADQAEEYDRCLIHAEISLFCIGEHGVAVERVSHAALLTRKQGHQHQCCRRDTDSQLSDGSMFMPVKVPTGVRKNVCPEHEQAASRESKTELFGMMTAFMIHLMRHAPPEGDCGENLDHAVPPKAREGGAASLSGAPKSNSRFGSCPQNRQDFQALPVACQ